MYGRSLIDENDLTNTYHICAKTSFPIFLMNKVVILFLFALLIRFTEKEEMHGIVSSKVSALQNIASCQMDIFACIALKIKKNSF